MSNSILHCSHTAQTKTIPVAYRIAPEKVECLSINIAEAFNSAWPFSKNFIKAAGRMYKINGAPYVQDGNVTGSAPEHFGIANAAGSSKDPNTAPDFPVNKQTLQSNKPPENSVSALLYLSCSLVNLFYSRSPKPKPCLSLVFFSIV